VAGIDTIIIPLFSSGLSDANVVSVAGALVATVAGGTVSTDVVSGAVTSAILFLV